MRTMAYKDSRIDLRVGTKQKSLLSYAAKIQDVKLSTFVLASALKEAQSVVAEKVDFALPKKQWDAFCSALDRPAQDLPKLRQLFSGPSPFKS